MRSAIGHVLVLSLVLSITACENPGKDKPPAQVEKAVPRTEEGSQPVSEQIALTPANSKIEFIGSKVTGSHNGGFANFSGTIGLSPTGPPASRVNLDIDLGSVWTDAEKLTGHLKSPDFFDVATHPKATFASTRVEPAAAGGSSYTVTGNLDLHGVTKSISFPATMTVSPQEVAVVAEFTINRKDFGIVYAGAPDNLIRDEVVLKLSVTAPRSS